MFFEYLPDDPAKAGPCPGEELLCGYVERSLIDVELRWVETHLPLCRDCRETLIFAALVPVPPMAADGVREGQPSRVRVVLCEALQGAQVLAEQFIELLFPEGREPVFRSAAGMAAPPAVHEHFEREVALGPYLLKVPGRGSASKGSCRLQLIGSSGAPIASVPYEVELTSGRRILGITDVEGWMDLGDLNVNSVATIWLAMQ